MTRFKRYILQSNLQHLHQQEYLKFQRKHFIHFLYKTNAQATKPTTSKNPRPTKCLPHPGTALRYSWLVLIFDEQGIIAQKSMLLQPEIQMFITALEETHKGMYPQLIVRSHVLGTFLTVHLLVEL